MLNRRLLWPLILALLPGCGQANKLVSPPPPVVTVALPIERPVTDTIEFIGSTEPTRTVILRAEVKGYLEQILFKDGADVKAGDELFLLEQAPYQLALDAAKAAKQKADATLELAESQYRRMAPLVKTGVVTQEDLDVQAAQVATSKADVAAAQAAERTAAHDLSYTHIKAPFAGRVGRHLVEKGELVKAEETPLADIQCIDPIYARFDVSENDYLRFSEMLRKNQLPDPDRDPPVLRLRVANQEGFPHVGKLDFRDQRVTQSTGTTMRRAIFPNPGLQLLPGMFVQLQASVGGPTPRVLVEERAVCTDQRGDYLLVVNDKNIVENRPVRLGSHVDTLRVIEEGVTTKDWVVVNGLQRARPGAQVTPEMAVMGATEAKKTSNVKKVDSTKKADEKKAPEKPKPAPPAKANPDEAKSKSELKVDSAKAKEEQKK